MTDKYKWQQSRREFYHCGCTRNGKILCADAQDLWAKAQDARIKGNQSLYWQRLHELDAHRKKAGVHK